MISDPWYEAVSADSSLMQGDIIFDCPVLIWIDGLPGDNRVNTEIGLAEPISVDVVVMTQACDLEQGHVQNVVLCPHDSLEDHRVAWETAMSKRNQNPSPKAWRGHCDDIRNGYLWNLALLNSGRARFTIPPQADALTEVASTKIEVLEIAIRVVDFHEIYTIPKIFLEKILSTRKQPRIRLRPPYREHLSQAFARYFMRVGLPEPVNRIWE